jgi:hypothetical protein
VRIHPGKELLVRRTPSKELSYTGGIAKAFTYIIHEETSWYKELLVMRAHGEEILVRSSW